MTIQEALRHARATLLEAGIERPDAEAWWLLEALTGSQRADLVIAGTRSLDADQVSRLDAALARRASREPLQHILGHVWFYGLELKIDPRALVPRPETERLVELALERLQDVDRPRVLDVGTGSGAIALAIAAERPDARVMATDVRLAPLELARENADQLDLRVSFARSDLLAAPEVAAFACRAHAIVSNPPYLPDDDRGGALPELRYEPPDALYGGPTGIELFTALAAQAHALCTPGTWLLAELDPRTVGSARASASAWTEATVEEDLTGRPRFLALRR